jgi:hypothetical protein
VQVTNLPVKEPSPTQHRWPDLQRGPWTVTLHWQIIDGRPECCGMDISAEGDILTVSLLRKMPIADWIAADRAAMAPRPASTAGLRQSTIDRLTVTAEVYQQARRDGQHPAKAVAEHFGISAGGASNLVARARAVGLLPPTSPGVPTG